MVTKSQSRRLQQKQYPADFLFNIIIKNKAGNDQKNEKLFLGACLL